MEPQLANKAPEEFIKAATHLVERAKAKNITIRVLGATAILIHVGTGGPFLDVFKSYRTLTDIDFVAYRSSWSKIEDFFHEEQFQSNDRFNSLHGNKQLNFTGPNDLRADVFCDKLNMSHVVDFTGRLELDYPTIPLADLLLEKMQIVRINEKDIKDTILMLRTHEVGDQDNDTVNAKWVAMSLKNDWGFWYTVTTNLNKVNTKKNEYDWLSKEDREVVESKIKRILEFIDAEPKSSGWKFRARIGTKKKWYTDVEERSIT